MGDRGADRSAIDGTASRPAGHDAASGCSSSPQQRPTLAAQDHLDGRDPVSSPSVRWNRLTSTDRTLP
jgi:hypothetical protein